METVDKHYKTNLLTKNEVLDIILLLFIIIIIYYYYYYYYHYCYYYYDNLYCAVDLRHEQFVKQGRIYNKIEEFGRALR